MNQIKTLIGNRTLIFSSAKYEIMVIQSVDDFFYTNS
jgi:hypothetical protein